MQNQVALLCTFPNFVCPSYSKGPMLNMRIQVLAWLMTNDYFNNPRKEVNLQMLQLVHSVTRASIHEKNNKCIIWDGSQNEKNRQLN